MNQEARIAQAKALVEAWEQSVGASVVFLPREREALIAAIAAAPCGECAHIKEQNQRIRERLGWTEGDLLNTNIREEGEALATQFKRDYAINPQLSPHGIHKAASRPSPGDEATAQRIADVCGEGRTWTRNELVGAVKAALTASRNALIKLVEAKRDEWQKERDRTFRDRFFDVADQREAQVRAANEILSALRKETKDAT
jgi:hypothetical protein